MVFKLGLAIAIALAACGSFAANKLESEVIDRSSEIQCCTAKQLRNYCERTTIGGHDGWRSPTFEELESRLREQPYRHGDRNWIDIYTLHEIPGNEYYFGACVIKNDGDIYNCHHQGYATDVKYFMCVRGTENSASTKPSKSEASKSSSIDAAPSIRLYAKNPDDDKAKAEAARKKAEDDAKANDKARQQKVAQARADDELKRLDQDLKQRQACMKPEVRKQNIGCMCDRFFPPPPDDRKGGARGCSQ